MIKVSVIVPVYNAEKYLNKCMDSLVHQTLEEIEIVAVDDGSMDCSREILEEYQKTYPEKLVVFHQENKGQAAARNLAIRNARGEYVGFTDADDYVDSAMFEELYAAAKRAEADLAACDHWRIVNGKSEYNKFADYKSARDMLLGVLVSPWNKLIRRRVLQDSGVVFPEGYIYEDTAWFAELIPFIRKLTVVHKPLVYHVVRENSTMTIAQGERTAQIFPVMDGVVEFYRRNQLFDSYERELEFFYVRILLFSSMRRIWKIRDRKLRNQFIKKTFEKVREQFPNYRKNPCLKGVKGLYIGLVTPNILMLIPKALVGCFLD